MTGFLRVPVATKNSVIPDLRDASAFAALRRDKSHRLSGMTLFFYGSFIHVRKPHPNGAVHSRIGITGLWLRNDGKICAAPSGVVALGSSQKGTFDPCKF